MKEPQQNQNKVRTGPETGRQTKVRPKCVKRETIKIETKMKKQMKRTVYEAPVTELFRVELEGDFMAASIVDEDNKTTVNISGHETGDTFDVGGQFETKNDGTIDGWY